MYLSQKQRASSTKGRHTIHALGEIKAENRYMTQPSLDGGWDVVDRVNGSKVGTYASAAEAAVGAKERNTPAIN